MFTITMKEKVVEYLSTGKKYLRSMVFFGGIVTILLLAACSRETAQEIIPVNATEETTVLAQASRYIFFQGVLYIGTNQYESAFYEQDQNFEDDCYHFECGFELIGKIRKVTAELPTEDFSAANLQSSENDSLTEGMEVYQNKYMNKERIYVKIGDKVEQFVPCDTNGNQIEEYDKEKVMKELLNAMNRFNIRHRWNPYISLNSDFVTEEFFSEISTMSSAELDEYLESIAN